MWSVILAFIPKKYLIGAAGAVLILGTLVGFIAHHQHALKAMYFQKGYAVAADSAREATIVREIAFRDSAARNAIALQRAAVDSTRKADSAAARLMAVTERRHISISVTDRSHAANVTDQPQDTVPLVVVTSDASGKHWLLPRDAALEWQQADSLLQVATALLQRYAAANQQWARAYAIQGQALQAADSALTLARQQPDTVYAPRHNAIRHDVMLVIDGVLLAKYGPALLRGLAHLHGHL